MSKEVNAYVFSECDLIEKLNLCDGNYWYVEASKDYKNKDCSSLGKLPFKYKLKFEYKGKSVIGIKAGCDRGAPKGAKIGLHKKLADKIGFHNSNDIVKIKNA